MRPNLLSAVEVVYWNRRILGLLGMWPEDSRNFRFSVFFGYLVIHVTLEYAYLCQNIRHLESVVTSMTENIPFTVVLIKAVFFRKYKNLLCKILRKVNSSFATDNRKSKKEVEIFLKYNRISKNFVRVVMPLVLLSSIGYFLKPLLIQLVTNRGNDTVIYDLPYRVRLFYDVTDPRVYFLTYALQAPLVVIVTFGYTGTDCFLVTLTLHVCGELSILAYRIKNLNCDTRGSYKAIQILIDRHVQLIRLVSTIEHVFNLLLLGQLFGGTFLLCFLGYNVLANTTGGRETDLLNFSFYGFSVVVLLYIHCYVGDCLMQESLKVRDAFCHCSWHKMPSKQAKLLVPCIAQSQKPLYLSAGKLYIFSLERFADVMKTSAAYLSVLRTFL